jgi:hypothetical protein
MTPSDLESRGFHMIRKVILTAVLLFVMQGLVFAQTDFTVEFYGSIQSVNSTAIVINGQIVDGRDTVVNAPLAAGTAVRVQATMLSDGSFAARQIEVLPSGIIPGIVEINGTVTDFALPILTINAQAIDISGTEISGSVVVGQAVRVFAVAIAPGLWQARFVDAGGTLPGAAPEVLVPATTPEVLPPLTTPEVSDDDDDDNDDNDDDDD